MKHFFLALALYVAAAQDLRGLTGRGERGGKGGGKGYHGKPVSTPVQIFGPEFECTDPCNLEMNTLEVSATLQGDDPKEVAFSTRVFGTRTNDVFQGSLPGPTMRFRSGETKHVTVLNNLSPVDNGVVSEENFNEGHLPNTTNIHTHGVHISGEAPGDDVSIQIQPGGGSFDYIYEMPPNHMGGTFFYHTHSHGSVSLQLGGGAAGILIVEDAPGEVPDFISNMKEVLVFMMFIDVSLSVDLQNNFVTTYPTLWQVEPPIDTAQLNYLLLVNGLATPEVEVNHGEWYRFRFLWSASEEVTVLRMEESADQTCELQLIAKDGIYLNDAPRAINKIYLGQANRADIAVRCTGSEGRINILADLKKVAMAEVPLMALKVIGDTNHMEPDLQAFSVNRPCYLVDTVGLPGQDVATSAGRSRTQGVERGVDASFPLFFYHQHHLDVPFLNGQLFKGHQFFLNKDNDGSVSVDPLYVPPLASDNIATGGQGPPPFEYPTEDVPMNTGSLVHLTMSGLENHMSHVHVNSYQIQSYEAGESQQADTDYTTYFKIGDWHDTLFLGFSQVDSPFFASDVRFWVDRFTGKAVLHCHDLQDEDHGMMNGFYYGGREGKTVDSRTRLIDPTCYSTSKKCGYTLK